MQPADDIKRLFRDAELVLHAEPDDRIFAEMARAQEQQTQRPRTLPDIWRQAMRKPIVKLSMAAVVVFACLFGNLLWRGTGSGVVLADVLTQIQQVKAYLYQMTSTATMMMGEDKTIDVDSQISVLISPEHGTKMVVESKTGNQDETTIREHYMVPQNNSVLMITPKQKTFIKMELDDKGFQEMQQKNNDPNFLVQMMLNSEHTRLGRSTIDGVEVEGFQTTDPKYQGGMFEQADVKLWVNVDTRLPVRSEMDIRMSNQRRMHMVIYDFRWDVAVDATEFNPVIPDDFTSMTGGPVKMPVMNEETALAGLRLFAEKSGAYPESLGMTELMDGIKDLISPEIMKEVRSQEKSGSKPSPEMIKKLTEAMMPMQSLMGFHMQLVQGDKDPAYHGKVVGPDDADQALMRWKISDSEYRVIFGDLHVDTVTTEALAELEKALPAED